MPIPVSDRILAHNINVAISDIIRLFEDADHVRGRAKTVYYKSILLLAASVLEALVYHYLDCHCKADPTLLSKADGKTLKHVQELSTADLGTIKALWIAEEIPEKAKFKTIAGSSKTMNKFCLDQGLIDRDLFDELEYARKKRNQVHLQTLDSTSRSYTVAMIDRIGRAVDKMYTKLTPFNQPSTGQSA